MAKKTKKKAKKEGTKSRSPYGDMSIEQLLKALGNSEDPIEKRKIRAQLRKAGHTGGLNKAGTKSKKTSKKKTSKKKKSAKNSQRTLSTKQATVLSCLLGLECSMITNSYNGEEHGKEAEKDLAGR